MNEEIIIRKIDDRKGMKDFLQVARDIYKGYKQYVPDWEGDIVDFFNPEKNPGLAFSDVQPFVAYRHNEPIGRIAGIVNHKANQRWQVRNVRFSMMEFIDDVEVSAALLHAVAEWGTEKGMDTLQGPMGITDFDKEGMLVEDFSLEGSMSAYYNPDYYPRHVEAFGMRKETDWVQIRIDVPKEVPAKYSRVAQYVREQMRLRVVKATKKEMMQGGMGRKVFQLLNEAYKPIFGFSELSEAQIDYFVEKYVQLIDLKLVPVVLNELDEVVGVAITMGSLSGALIKSQGRLWPMGWYHLLKSLRWKPEDHAEMLLIGVRPDYQGMGVNALFFDDLIPIYNKYGFRRAETGPQLEDNVRELSQWKPLHPQYVKRRRCYMMKLTIDK